MRKLLATALLILCLTPNLWALDSLGTFSAGAFSFSIIDGIAGLRYESPASDGNLHEMKVYLAVTTGTQNVKCGFYLWPDTTLVDSTEIVAAVVDTGWVTFKFIDSAAIYADSNYCLMVWAEQAVGDVHVYYALSGNDWARDILNVYGVWPAVLNSIDNVNAYPISIYATYEPTAVAAGQMITIQP